MHELWVLKERSSRLITMLWSDVNKSLIHVDENGTFTYGGPGKPFRFQIPIGYTDEGISEWSRISLKIDSDEFFKWFSDIEDYIGKQEPFDSIIESTNGTINVKYDEKFTQIFDMNKNLIFEGPPSLSNSKLYVILEVSKKYGPFKERYGLVTKAYQIVWSPGECMFT